MHRDFVQMIMIRNEFTHPPSREGAFYYFIILSKIKAYRVNDQQCRLLLSMNISHCYSITFVYIHTYTHSSVASLLVLGGGGGGQTPKYTDRQWRAQEIVMGGGGPRN